MSARMLRRAAGLAAVLAGTAAACTPTPRAEPSVDTRVDALDPMTDESRLDARLRRIAVADPDTVVAVLVRTARPVGPAEREALEAAGLSVRSVAGEILTGRIRAGAALDLARLPFVRYVEASTTLSPTDR